MSRKLICLDIGHGKDTYSRTGSKGVPSMAEFEFNNAVVKYALPLFEHNGFDVLLTQPIDANDVPLQARTDLANSKGADLLLSFHADANSNTGARGHWSFYWYTSADGKRLADLWSEELTKATGTNHRGNRASKPGEWTNFHMVRKTSMVAVLMEHAFMTNEQDLALLKSDDFRRQCAEASVKAVCRYYNQAYKEIPQVSVTKYDDVASWAREAWEWAVSDGITDGTKPTANITRQEFVTMLYRALKGGK